MPSYYTGKYEEVLKQVWCQNKLQLRFEYVRIINNIFHLQVYNILLWQVNFEIIFVHPQTHFYWENVYFNWKFLENIRHKQLIYCSIVSFIILKLIIHLCYYITLFTAARKSSIHVRAAIFWRFASQDLRLRPG